MQRFTVYAVQGLAHVGTVAICRMNCLTVQHGPHTSNSDLAMAPEAGQSCFQALTWTPKVCRIIAVLAVFKGLGLLFYILLGFRYD